MFMGTVYCKLGSILQRTVTTNILSSRLTAPGSPRMGELTALQERVKWEKKESIPMQNTYDLLVGTLSIGDIGIPS